MPQQNGRNTEVFAYRFILNDLELLGWNIKSPSQQASGQVYTQRQCLDNEHIAEQLVQMHPENVVKISENDFYVIEAKREREQLEQALSEAKDDYATKINKSHNVKARIISGVAGNENDGYLVKSQFLENDGRFKTIKSNKYASKQL